MTAWTELRQAIGYAAAELAPVTVFPLLVRWLARAIRATCPCGDCGK